MTAGRARQGLDLILRTASSTIGLLLALALLSSCNRSHFETPELQGRAAMVDDGGTKRLWVLTKQEESRQISVGGGGSRNSPDWRTDTFFHFDVQAFDPVAAKRLWKQRLLSIGDDEAEGRGPSRVIGSDVDAKLLGQDGELVWLLIGQAPFALRAADGSVAADAEALERINPTLKGLLPVEAKYYAFDQGLVLTAADARQFVIRGPQHTAIDYSPPPPSKGPEGRLQSNGTRETVPMRPPFDDAPVRQVRLQGEWLGLFSPKEAADAAADDWGSKLHWPYTVLSEGKQTRRSFWRAAIGVTSRFDERHPRLTNVRPIPNAPTFLYGRFAKELGDEARVLDDPLGVLVWHSTRIDAAGRLALTWLDTKLATIWNVETPLSEPDTFGPFATWWLPGHLVAVGEQRFEEDGVSGRAPYLVSVALEDGAMRVAPLTEAAPTE